MASSHGLSEEQKLSFVSDGYVILRGFVPSESIETALNFIDNAYANGQYTEKTRKILGEEQPIPDFETDVKNGPEVLDLIFKTGLLDVTEDLLGEEHATVRDNEGHVAFAPPCRNFIEQGMDLQERYPKRRWHLDGGEGKHKMKGSGFSLLVSVALSEGQDVDENRGQVMIWPGSHLVTHRGIAEAVENNADGNALRDFLQNKQDCGKPERALLQPGDVLIAHQRLAHAPGVNLTNVTRKNVFFRITHALIDEIVDEQIRSPTPWVGFEGLAEFVEEDATEFVGKPKRDGESRAGPVVSSRGTFSTTGLNLTQEQKETFIRDGFVILPGAVSEDLVQIASDFVDKAYEDGSYNLNGAKKPGAKHPVPGFYKPIKQSAQIMNLLHKSGLFEVADELVGKGNATIRDKQGQIAYTTPNEIYREEGKDMKEPHPKRKWHIDAGHGKYAALGSDFSFLVGVCLSDGQHVDENRGQFTVWPGSHLITHPAIGEVISTTPADDVVRTFKGKRLNVGGPKRALLHPGDAMIAHQRLSHAAGVNLCDIVRKNVYFRVVHRQLDVLLDDFVKSSTPWVGFEGLRGLLPEVAVDWDREAAKKKGRQKLAAGSTGEHCGNFKLSTGQKKAFVRDGYVVLPGAVSVNLVGRALEFVDKAFDNNKYHTNGKKGIGSDHPAPAFLKPVKRSPNVKDLFFKSGLVDASEQLIGEGHVTVRENMAEISFNAPNEIFVGEGMDRTEPFPKRRWRVEPGQGVYKGRGGDFNFLVGVALSDGQDIDENAGQVTVWPGSHVTIHPILSEIVREGPPESVMRTFRSKKIDCGKPERLLMKPGDAFIVHQRLGIAEGINLSDHVRKNVYFRVVHTDFDELLDDFLEAELPFTGFEPIADIVAEELSN